MASLGTVLGASRETYQRPWVAPHVASAFFACSQERAATARSSSCASVAATAFMATPERGQGRLTPAEP